MFWRKPKAIVLLSMTLALGFAVWNEALLPSQVVAKWTMINVCSGSLQADSHLIQVTNGPTFLIDAGDYSGALLSFLKTENISKIDRILVSHPHKDHYSGISGLLTAGIQISGISITLPNRISCDAERPWGCDYPHLLETLMTLKSYNVALKPLRVGDVIFENQTSRFEVLFALDGQNDTSGAFTSTDINDLSQILRLKVGKTRILFTGDANHKLGKFLVERPFELKAEILKVPHHGTESTVDDDFFERVNADTAFVPAPRELWESKRSQRIREILAKSGTKVYVSGIHGNITTLLTLGGFEVVTQFKEKPEWENGWMKNLLAKWVPIQK